MTNANGMTAQEFAGTLGTGGHESPADWERRMIRKMMEVNEAAAVRFAAYPDTMRKCEALRVELATALLNVKESK